MACETCGGALPPAKTKRHRFCKKCKQARDKATKWKRYNPPPEGVQPIFNEVFMTWDEIAEEVGLSRYGTIQIGNMALHKFRENWMAIVGEEMPTG